MTGKIVYGTRLVFRDEDKGVTRVLPTLVSMVVKDSILVSSPMGGRNPPVFAGMYAGTEDTVREGIYVVTGVERVCADDDNSFHFELTYNLDRNTRR